jgi:hypothetical protein
MSGLLAKVSALRASVGGDRGDAFGSLHKTTTTTKHSIKAKRPNIAQRAASRTYSLRSAYPIMPVEEAAEGSRRYWRK